MIIHEQSFKIDEKEALSFDSPESLILHNAIIVRSRIHRVKVKAKSSSFHTWNRFVHDNVNEIESNCWSEWEFRVNKPMSTQAIHVGETYL